MKKTIITLVVIIIFGALVFPYQRSHYEDGTKLYTALTYQYIQFNTLEGCKASKFVFGGTKRSYEYFHKNLCELQRNSKVEKQEKGDNTTKLQQKSRELGIGEVMQSFGNILGLKNSDIKPTNFDFYDVQQKKIPIQGYKLVKENVSSNDLENINKIFGSWKLYHAPADGLEEILAWYEKNDIVCLQHTILHGNPEEIETINDPTYTIHITCGKNTHNNSVCINKKIAFIKKANTIKDYIKKMNDALYSDNGSGLRDFEIALEDNNGEKADYFVLSEIHSAEDGDIRVTNTRRFRWKHDEKLPEEYNVENDIYTTMEYDQDIIDTYMKEVSSVCGK